MNIEGLQAEIIDKDKRVRFFRLKSERLLDFAIDCWPEEKSDLLDDQELLGTYLKSAVGMKYRQKYGFDPITLFILGIIIKLLIEWWFDDAENRGGIIRRLRDR